MASKMADSSTSSSTPGSTHGATSATARNTSTAEEDTLDDVEDESDRASLSSTEAELDSTVLKFQDRRLPKKRKALASGGGKFKLSWNLPPHIVGSRKGTKFAKCTLCHSDFSVSHGGFNDVIRYVNSPVHVERLKDAQSSPNISSLMAKDHP